MINPLGQGLSVGSPSQPSADADLLIFPVGMGPTGAGTPWGSSGEGFWGNLFPKALLSLLNHALSHSRHLKNSAKGWGGGLETQQGNGVGHLPARGRAGQVGRSEMLCVP